MVDNFQIAKDLQDLVTYHLPATATEAQIQRLLSYSYRILSSRVSSSYVNGSSAADQDHIKQLLLKKVSQKSRANNPRITLGQETQQFETLYFKLRRSTLINKKNEILQLLLALSGEENNNTVKILESVFNNKIMNKVDYQAQQQIQKKKQQADVEMKDQSQSTLKSQSTKQKQLEYLRTMRFNNASGDINEDVIVRDLLFVFQGINGQHIQYSLLEDAYVISPTLTVSPSTRKIINELCELGWLFRRVNEWLTRNFEMQAHCNQVTQSLCFAIQGELTEYYRLLAILESQRTKYSMEDAANYLNLKKLYLWIQDPLERMKWLAIIIDSVLNLKGGAVCSAINSYVLNGSPSTKQFISRILKEVSSPILSMIKQWMIEGEINDPFNEFFVEMDPMISDDKLWTEKYKLNYIMIPSFLSNSLAHKILLTGKAVNFIRRCCNEQDWILDISMQLPFEASNLVGSASQTFQHLKSWVDHAYQVTNQQLLKILFQKYKFEGHCSSIRKYLLMGQGDFMQYLMDLLSDELNNSAAQIYKHSLQGYLETAVRSSNAQYHDPEFLSRLDIKLMESSPGDKGWEIFMLDYRVNDLSPLSTVFTEEIMQNYSRIFFFLWRLKRIEYSLSQSWRKNQEHSHKFDKIKGMKGVFHKFNLYHHEMVHFVSNIHNYIMVEVLESAWKIFQDEIKTAQDLDELIEVQRKFVNSILDKALLNDKNQSLYRLLQKLLNQVYLFTFKKEFFYNKSIEEYERIMGNQDKSLEQLQEEDVQAKISLQSIQHMELNHEEFMKVFYQFKNELLQSNQTNLKYLQCRLDFNEYYYISEARMVQKQHDLKLQDNDLDDLDGDDYDDEDDDDDDDDDDDEGDYGDEDGEGLHMRQGGLNDGNGGQFIQQQNKYGGSMSQHRGTAGMDSSLGLSSLGGSNFTSGAGMRGGQYGGGNNMY